MFFSASSNSSVVTSADSYRTDSSESSRKSKRSTRLPKYLEEDYYLTHVRVKRTRFAREDNSERENVLSYHQSPKNNDAYENLFEIMHPESLRKEGETISDKDFDYSNIHEVMGSFSPLVVFSPQGVIFESPQRVERPQEFLFFTPPQIVSLMTGEVIELALANYYHEEELEILTFIADHLNELFI
jgi:hypothetical protein